jgi:hypothetical protein
MRKTCIVCDKPGVPKQYYAFCSQACGARWALWTIRDYNEVGQVWCRRHGWVPVTEGCHECDTELCRRCEHKRRHHGKGHDDPELNGCQECDNCTAFVGLKYGVAE